MTDNKIGTIFTGLLTTIFGITMCVLSMQIDDIESSNTSSCSNTLKTFNKIMLIAGTALSSFGILFFILSFSNTCYINNINGNIYLVYFLLLGILLCFLGGAILSQDDCNGSKQSSIAVLILGILSCIISILWLIYTYYKSLKSSTEVKENKGLFSELDLRFNRFA